MIKHILVDIANLSFPTTSDRQAGRRASYQNVRSVKVFFGKLKKRYPCISYFCLADSSLIHMIDEPFELERDFQKCAVLECPAGLEADDFLLEFLNMHPDDTIIVSNDLFRDHQAPKTARRRWHFQGMVVRGQVLIPGLIDLLEAECGPGNDQSPTGAGVANA
jgi:hypothetical protein